MSNDYGSSTQGPEDTIQSTRLARGLRAVAATLIVGGIVIAALETGEPVSRSVPGDTPFSQIRSGAATGEATPTAVSPTTPPSLGADPMLERLDRAMEQHG
jgi:hypothetical protein